MILLSSPSHVSTVESQQRRLWLQTVALVLAVTWLTIVTAVVAHSTAPEPFSLAFIVLVLCCIASIARPVLGVYAIIFLSLIGDTRTTVWWPFTKNMSSRESIFFVSDAFSMTPLEVLLSVTFVGVILRVISDPTWRFRKGRLFGPVMVFGVLVVLGFVHGAMTQHNRTVAILEARPLMYLVAVYVLITTLFTERRQYRIAFALAMLAIAIQSLFALKFWRGMTYEQRELAESLSEHTAAVAMNVVFVCLIGFLLFNGTRWKRLALLLMTPTVLYVYLLSQRRAAMIALFGGFVVLFGVLYCRNRRLFWKLTPVIVVLGLLYVVATWNLEGAFGLPATAVKTVLFSGQLSEEDQRSDLYREIEAHNLWFTIRRSPLTGFGFGHRFLLVWRLPDISFFEYWQYLPHNSVLWVWIKTGFFGFATMLFMFARAMQIGARNAVRLRSSDDAAIVTAAVAYVLMFIIFAYVDIGWDIRPAIVLALCFALATDFIDAGDEPRLAAAPPQRLDRELDEATV